MRHGDLPRGHASVSVSCDLFASTRAPAGGAEAVSRDGRSALFADRHHAARCEVLNSLAAIILQPIAATPGMMFKALVLHGSSMSTRNFLTPLQAVGNISRLLCLGWIQSFHRKETAIYHCRMQSRSVPPAPRASFCRATSLGQRGSS